MTVKVFINTNDATLESELQTYITASVTTLHAATTSQTNEQRTVILFHD